MIYGTGNNIVSPLGLTTEENLSAVLRGETAIRSHGKDLGLPEECVTSMFCRQEMEKVIASEVEGHNAYSFFEAICILSAQRAVREAGIDAASDDVLFVLSSTKGNVEFLEDDLHDARCYIGGSAGRIAGYFGNRNIPVVASNACISGVCAQIAAARALMTGRYSRAIVIGADVLSKFIVSGFQSFKALSPERCRPYDRDRRGLNLGEAASALILERGEKVSCGAWCYEGGSIHNDANHISGPSRTGEGSYRVLSDLLEKVGAEELACINAHGTATAYNDEMESIAIHRAGLDTLPVNGLKGIYGHTLGAAGVMETVLSMAAVMKGILLPTPGYENCGTSYGLNLSDRERTTDRRAFFKILSGFGGSNAGVAYRYKTFE